MNLGVMGLGGLGVMDVKASGVVEIRGRERLDIVIFLREYGTVERSGSTKLLGYPLHSRWCLKVGIVLS